MKSSVTAPSILWGLLPLECRVRDTWVVKRAPTDSLVSASASGTKESVADEVTHLVKNVLKEGHGLLEKVTHRHASKEQAPTMQSGFGQIEPGTHEAVGRRVHESLKRAVYESSIGPMLEELMVKRKE